MTSDKRAFKRITFVPDLAAKTDRWVEGIPVTKEIELLQIPVMVWCARCDAMVHGAFAFQQAGRLFETCGFGVLDDEGPICERCQRVDA